MIDMADLSICGSNFSKEGSHMSGDDWIAHEFANFRVCGVLDGARSPSEGLKQISGVASDVFVARWLKQEMMNHLLAHPQITLTQAVQKVNYRFGDMWTQLLMNEKQPFMERKKFAPAAAFAFAMERDGILTWAQGADCVLFLALPSGKVIPLALDQFDDIAPEKKSAMVFEHVQTLLKEGVSVEEVLRRENATIAHNRALIYNQVGGIAVMNGEPTMIDVMETGMLDVSAYLGSGAKVIAMTDGCFQKLGRDSSLAAMTAVQLIMQKGMDGLKEALLLIQDPFPTDATATYMVL